MSEIGRILKNKLSPLRVKYICIVYFIEEVTSFQGAWSINGHGMAFK